MFGSMPLSAMLPAKDYERALSWYAEKLGLEPVERNDEGGAAWFETGGHRFLVYASEFAGTNQATAAGFSVEDFDGTMSALRDKGVAFEDYDFGEDFRTTDGVLTLPDGSQICWFKDSEGNILSMAKM